MTIVLTTTKTRMTNSHTQSAHPNITNHVPHQHTHHPRAQHPKYKHNYIIKACSTTQSLVHVKEHLQQCFHGPLYAQYQNQIGWETQASVHFVYSQLHYFKYTWVQHDLWGSQTSCQQGSGATAQGTSEWPHIPYLWQSNFAQSLTIFLSNTQQGAIFQTLDHVIQAHHLHRNYLHRIQHGYLMHCQIFSIQGQYKATFSTCQRLFIKPNPTQRVNLSW